MANNTKLLPGGPNIIHAPLVDKDGNITLIWNSGGQQQFPAFKPHSISSKPSKASSASTQP